MPETRTIRDMLMTYGANGGKRLTDAELVNLMINEFNSLPIEAKRKMYTGINLTADEMVIGGARYS